MKIVIAIITLFLFTAFSVGSVSAQANMCNQRCEVDTDCGSGYSCYVGVCRLKLCPASSSCSCGTGVSPTPIASPKVTPQPTATPKATSTPKPTATPKPSASPKPTASVSATLTQTPKTGAASWVTAGLAGILFLSGTALAGTQAVFAHGGKSPQEISKARKSSQE